MDVPVCRPVVFCVMMSTIDGKIGRRSPGADVVDEYIDVYRMIDDTIATSSKIKGNAWMCGRVTSQLYFSDTSSDVLPLCNTVVLEGDYIAPKTNGRYFVTFDTNGILRWKKPTISFYPEHGDLNLIIIVNESTPKEYLGYLHELGISYLICGTESVDVASVLTKLYTRFDIHQVLLEGGGKLNGSFIQAGLIDELYVLVVPRVLNKASEPCVFDSSEDANSALYQFSLIETKVMNRESVLLHYRKK